MSIKKINKKSFQSYLSPTYGRRIFNEPVAKYQLPKKSIDSKVAYDLIHDELMLDGNARLNLATFVTTWMEPEAKQLMSETFDKNMIDKDEYPQTAEIETRCVHMLANLWNSPESKETIGCSTTGSSEACMLAGMAFKWKWRERMKKLGKSADKPNLIMGINVQVCWEKFCRYWDIEMRQVPMEEGRYVISPEKAIALCDENTIGVVAILGSTYTGEYEPIQALNAALEKLNKKSGWEIPIHVDAASGGFVAPFIQPDLIWDFRLKWVKSINASGHKYGLVYPGVGWVVWRDRADLPEELIFNVNYLGGEMPTFALNFSRPGNQVIAQYYNFLRLGREGYERIHRNSQAVALYLSQQITQLGPFVLLSDGSDLPVFSFRLKEPTNFSVFDFSERLRFYGWLIPAYTLPENLTQIAVIRIVIREGFSRELADMLIEHMKQVLSYFVENPQSRDSREPRSGFHH